jgi:hypothetical protein
VNSTTDSHFDSHGAINRAVCVINLLSSRRKKLIVFWRKIKKASKTICTQPTFVILPHENFVIGTMFFKVFHDEK